MIPMIKQFSTLLSAKVDKVTGKELSTNDFTDTYKNKLDGIATGATKNTVENSLTSTSASNALSAAQGKALNDKYNGTTLYNNATGTTGTITLSETAANFSYLNIFYYRQDNDYGAIKVATPNGKRICLYVPFVTGGGNTVQLPMRRVTVSGTSLTATNEYYVNITSNGNSISTQNKIYIYKVVGYK